MCQLCTCVLQGKMYWESKSVRGMGSHASIFLNSQDPLEYPPRPSVHPYKQMSALELQERSITPSYILRIQYWLEIKWVVAWGLFGKCRQFERKILCVCILYTSVYFFHSQDVLSGSEAPLLLRESRYTVRAISHLFVHLLPATSSSFQERNINWAWLHLSKLLYVSC